MMNYRSNVVVFGGTSFIGRHLSAALSCQNCKVVSINNPYTRKSCEYAEQNISVDICNPSSYKKSLQKVIDACSGTIDCAYLASWTGTNDRNNTELNKKSADGLFFCLEYLLRSAKCKKVIQLGTQAEYGRGFTTVTEMVNCNPLTAYGAQKLRFAHMANMLCLDCDVAFIEFRIHSVFGKGRGGIIEWLIEQLAEYGEARLETNCDQMFDYIYIDDCVDALILGKEHLKSGVYNISSGDQIRLRQYFDLVKEVVDPNASIVYGSVDDNTGPNFIFDSSKLRNETGWAPKYSFKQGIIKMCEL